MEIVPGEPAPSHNFVGLYLCN